MLLVESKKNFDRKYFVTENNNVHFTCFFFLNFSDAQDTKSSTSSLSSDKSNSSQDSASSDEPLIQWYISSLMICFCISALYA